VGALDDLGHGLHGLAAVIALAASVRIVQQEDPARAEAAGRAAHAPAPGLAVSQTPRSSRDLVALARRHARDERVAEAVRRPEEQRMVPVRARWRNDARAIQLLLDVRLGRERQQRETAVGRDLVAFLADAR
jgi:hypothetical protein